MKKTVFLFGLIAGVIVSGVLAFSTLKSYHNADYDSSMLLGYASMLVAFSFVFVGIKNSRDKYSNGIISFGKAFKIGLLISFIASTLYVLTWMIEYHFFIPDFMDNYCAQMLKQEAESGATAEALKQKEAQMASFKELYKNPLLIFLITYTEILPLGILISLISALILKRNKTQEVKV